MSKVVGESASLTSAVGRFVRKRLGLGRTGGTGIGRARLIKAAGGITPEPGAVHYSIPRAPWWRLTHWLWAARRYFTMRQEDKRWAKSHGR